MSLGGVFGKAQASAGRRDQQLARLAQLAGIGSKLRQDREEARKDKRFNIGGALAGAVGGAITGGPAGALAGGLQGGGTKDLAQAGLAGAFTGLQDKRQQDLLSAKKESLKQSAVQEQLKTQKLAQEVAAEPLKTKALQTKIVKDQQAIADKATKVAETKATDIKKAESLIGENERVVGKIDELLADPRLEATTGKPFGPIAERIPGSDTKAFRSKLLSVVSNQGIGTIEAMKAASKTGATGFGQLSEKELELIVSRITNLDPNIPPEDLRERLIEFRTFLIDANSRVAPEALGIDYKFNPEIPGVSQADQAASTSKREGRAKQLFTGSADPLGLFK